ISHDETRAVLESAVLAPLMHAAMHVASPAMSKNLRLLLAPFHEAKKDPSVDEMLYRLYSPILWRSLNAANSNVRASASCILADTFPLHDPAASAEDKVKVIKKGVEALNALMLDTDPKVRVAGGDAVARVLQCLWDTLAIKDVRALLNTLVTKQSSDTTSHLVRAGAVASVTAVLENPSSHGVMKAMLPLMSNLIHDDHQAVRLTVVKMLVKVKTMRGIKFYQIVKVPHIHARLAAEPADSPVAKELVALLLNSYFPQSSDVTASQQMSRTLDFMKKAPDAAKVFYSTLHNMVSVSGVAKLASMLLKCLSTAVETEKRAKEEEAKNATKGGKKRAAASSSSKLGTIGEDEESSDADSADAAPPAATSSINAADLPLMATISEAIFMIWSSVADKLKKPEHVKNHEYLVAAFQGTVLTDAHAYFENKAAAANASNNAENRYYSNRVCAALLQCAGRMPPSAISGLIVALTDKLRMASDMSEGEMTEGTAKELTPHLALLCLWGKSDQVCLSLGRSIERAVSGRAGDGEDGDDDGASAKTKKGSNKRRQREISDNSSATLLPSLKPACALIILKTIMSGSDASSIAARSNILSDDVARKALEEALESARSAAERFMTESKGSVLSETLSDVIVGSCEVRGRMAMHQEALLAAQQTDGEGDVLMELGPAIRSLLSWVSQAVVPALKGSAPAPDDNLLGLALSPIAKKGKFTEDGGEEEGAGSSSTTTTAAGKEMAICLLRSSLVLLGEWCAVGGGGAAEIAAFCEKWGGVLKTDAEIRTAVFLAYSRLFLELSRKGGVEGRGFWKAMLACGDLTEGEEATMKQVFTSVAPSNLRGGNRKDAEMGLRVAVEEIFAACKNDGGSEKSTMPKSVAELFPEGSEVPVVAQYAMTLVFNHAGAVKILVKMVVEGLKKVEEEGGGG
ncbi:hypothetical protein TeGR_g11025, partial [Tetraparma gracilis]